MKDNDIKYKWSWGTYSGLNSKKVTINTIYDIASITKLFTAACVLRLYEKGVIEITDKVSKYLAVFNKSEISIIDLLAHKANFGIKMSEEREKLGESFKENVFSIIPKITASKGINYENINYIYLGKLVEVVTGKDLAYNFMNLFQKLGLNNTYLAGKDEIDSPSTDEEVDDHVKNIVHDETARLMGGVAGHAGIFCDAIDLAKFGQCWLDEKIVNKEILDRIVFRNYDELNQYPMGLGWWFRVSILKIDIPNMFSHAGYTGCILTVNTETKTVKSFLCNRTYYGRKNYKHIEIWKIILEI